MTGPVAPAPTGVARLEPLSYTISGGFWGERQRVNAERSLPYTTGKLRTGGQWDNLRRAAGRCDGPHTGRPYTDSDVYKLAEAVAWDAGRAAAGAPPLLDEVTALVEQARDSDGYVNSWSRWAGRARYSDLPMGHELYCAGHLIQAGVAAYRSVGHTGLLRCATEFADQLVREFGPGQRAGVCGHPQIETALVELYRLTGRRDYLGLAVSMVDRRGHGLLGSGWYGPAYYQDAVPVRATTELDGHCVRALYLATGATDVYLETGDQELLAALIRQWEHTVAGKTYLTGGVGCRRKTEAFGAAFELPPDQAFGETCAAVANLMWSWRLLLATGAARYADHLERILFNALPAGVALDGERFAYVNTLHRRGTAMEHGDKAPYRKPWFDCACCPPNLLRTIAALGHYLATRDDQGVQLHQYAGGSVESPWGRIEVDTAYPWDGVVTLGLSGPTVTEWTLALRIPAWCTDSRVEVDGQPVESTVDNGYRRLRRRWAPGTTVTLRLAMPARLTWPDPRIDAVRGCAAVERGPLVYCVEQVDLPAAVPLDEIVLSTAQPPRPVDRPGLPGGVVGLELPVRRRPARGAAWPYRTDRPADPAGEPWWLTAIPYCAWDNRALGGMRVWLPTD